MSIPQMLAKADRAIEAVPSWRPLVNAPHGSQGYTGSANGWDFIVMAFSIEDQGFPPGSRGFDGAGTIVHGVGAGTIMRLTRELAEKAYRLAEAGAA
jgi:hypothetical protein